MFLREEVCAVSDHLAAVSLFGSEEWMSCLQHFDGWTVEKAEEQLRSHIRRLKLRPLNEPGDVESPLLRSQIDDHFLKAMAAQREQLREIPTTIEATKKERGQPPPYPRSSPLANSSTSALPHPTGVRRPRYAPHQQQGSTSYDNSSVQSGISTDSGFAPQYTEYPPQTHMTLPHYAPYYAAPHIYGALGAQYHMDPHQAGIYHSVPTHQEHGGWLDPALAPYGVPPYFGEVPHDASPSTDDGKGGTDKEQKEDHTSEVSPHPKTSPLHSPHQHHKFSPYWSHLVDGATQSLATPAKSPTTPSRPSPASALLHVPPPPFVDESDSGGSMPAQPLLLRGYPYGYGHYGARGGYAPPSPATQFMMAPTNQSSNFYYGAYSGSYSPGRGVGLRRSPKMGGITSIPPTPVRKMADIVSEPPSPSTVGTCTETDSLEEHPTV